MFSAIKGFVKYVLFIVFLAAFVLFLSDSKVSAFLNSPFVLYGLLFFIVLMLVTIAFMVGLPSLQEMKQDLLDYLDKLEKQADARLGKDDNEGKSEE